MKKLTLEWLKAAGIRAVKTFAQAFLATVGVAATVGEVEWGRVLSAALLAAILSLATSLAGLPEVSADKEHK